MLSEDLHPKRITVSKTLSNDLGPQTHLSVSLPFINKEMAAEGLLFFAEKQLAGDVGQENIRWVVVRLTIEIEAAVDADAVQDKRRDQANKNRSLERRHDRIVDWVEGQYKKSSTKSPRHQNESNDR